MRTSTFPLTSNSLSSHQYPPAPILSMRLIRLFSHRSPHHCCYGPTGEMSGDSSRTSVPATIPLECVRWIRVSVLCEMRKHSSILIKMVTEAQRVPGPLIVRRFRSFSLQQTLYQWLLICFLIAHSQ